MASILVMSSGLAAGGCGGGSGNGAGPATCRQVQPCGGDVVGSWSFQGACEDAAAASLDLASTCPGAGVSSVNIALTGSLVFNADMTYNASGWHETFSGNETVPLSCAGATACSDLNQSENQNTGAATVQLSLTCTGTTTCGCHVSGMLTLSSEPGTFTTAGTNLDMTGGGDGITSSSFSYCVAGDKLHLMELNSAGQIVSDIVAQKQ